MKVIDDKNKKLTWYNRNYFFAGTIIVIVVNILIFYFLGNDWEKVFKMSQDGTKAFNCANLIRLFMNAYSHSDWPHVLWNMLGVFVCGFYIERKIGSINMLLLILVLTPMANWTAGGNRLYVTSHGFSCVLYALYAFVIIDYIFSFQKHKRNKFNIILGSLIFIYIYISTGWDDTKSFPVVGYPINLIYHRGHLAGFIIGIIFSLCLQFTDVYVRNRTIKELQQNSMNKENTFATDVSKSYFNNANQSSQIDNKLANSQNVANVNSQDSILQNKDATDISNKPKL